MSDTPKDNAPRWSVTNRADPRTRPLADRHYNRQSVGAAQFVPPGRCLVLRADTPTGPGAFWVTSWPFAEYVKHAWAGAMVCSAFRNERQDLWQSSSLVREAVAITRHRWPDLPDLGMVTFIDRDKTRRKRDPGRCFRRAGFVDAGETKGGLVALQLWPDAWPEPMTAANHQGEFEFGKAL